MCCSPWGCKELDMTEGLNFTELNCHASKEMLKILHASLQHYVNQEHPDVQVGFRKGRATRDQTANIRWIIGKPREFQETIYFYFIDYANPFSCESQQTGNLLRDRNTKPPYLPLEKSV